MAGQVSFATIIVLLNFEYTRGGNLWCYECNTDLREGHTRVCNDPYVPTPYFDLVLCPQNETQQCLKSLIDYGDLTVTVRGCVPSREIDGYCQPREHFPGSSITCFFCEDYACNGQSSTYLFLLKNIVFLFVLINTAM
ncbi:uncharacterized protein LOC143424342 [Xylocopa sonorina]|uniref:uncharacterized protein LOC143424342 n=1 Tax=Xylocopa sonorina TaxID=1818115 RepID=UPI00403AE8E6